MMSAARQREATNGASLRPRLHLARPEEIGPHIARAVDPESSRADVNASIGVLLRAIADQRITLKDLATIMAARIASETEAWIVEVPAHLNAMMPDALAWQLIRALRKELGVRTEKVAKSEIGVRIPYAELAAMLGDVRDDRPAIETTVQKIKARVALSGADYAVIDLDPRIEETSLGKRVLRRLPLVAAHLAATGFKLGRLMLVIRAHEAALSPYARLLDVARVHFRAVACPGMQPDMLDRVSPGTSASHLV